MRCTDVLTSPIIFNNLLCCSILAFETFEKRKEKKKPSQHLYSQNLFPSSYCRLPSETAFYLFNNSFLSFFAILFLNPLWERKWSKKNSAINHSSYSWRSVALTLKSSPNIINFKSFFNFKLFKILSSIKIITKEL